MKYIDNLYNLLNSQLFTPVDISFIAYNTLSKEVTPLVFIT
nr:MAG TPA: hypothetical protein [Bacteriophage sp.]